MHEHTEDQLFWLVLTFYSAFKLSVCMRFQFDSVPMKSYSTWSSSIFNYCFNQHEAFSHQQVVSCNYLIIECVWDGFISKIKDAKREINQQIFNYHWNWIHYEKAESGQFICNYFSFRLFHGSSTTIEPFNSITFKLYIERGGLLYSVRRLWPDDVQWLNHNVCDYPEKLHMSSCHFSLK